MDRAPIMSVGSITSGSSKPAPTYLDEREGERKQTWAQEENGGRQYVSKRGGPVREKGQSEGDMACVKETFTKECFVCFQWVRSCRCPTMYWRRRQISSDVDLPPTYTHTHTHTHTQTDKFRKVFVVGYT